MKSFARHAVTSRKFSSVWPKTSDSLWVKREVGLVAGPVSTHMPPAPRASSVTSSSTAHDVFVDLVRELKQSDAEHKEKIAHKIATASTSAPADLPFQRLVPAVTALVAMLRSDFATEGGQQAAAGALAALAGRNDQLRREIATAGALPTLVTLLRTGSNKAAATAASALALLADVQDDRLTFEPKALIVRGGALPGLVRLLRVGTADAQANAALCISSVVRGRVDAQMQVGIPPLASSCCPRAAPMDAPRITARLCRAIVRVAARPSPVMEARAGARRSLTLRSLTRTARAPSSVCRMARSPSRMPTVRESVSTRRCASARL